MCRQIAEAMPTSGRNVVKVTSKVVTATADPVLKRAPLGLCVRAEPLQHIHRHMSHSSTHPHWHVDMSMSMSISTASDMDMSMTMDLRAWTCHRGVASVR